MEKISANKSQRFLLLIPIAIMIAFSLFFQRLTQEMDKNLLNEKFEEKKIQVNLLAYQIDEMIDEDHDWDTTRDWYKDTLIKTTEVIDKAYMTYGMVFDESLSQLFPEKIDDNSFNPTVYHEFLNEVLTHESGEMTLFFDPKDKKDPSRDMLVYYRWIPTGKEYNDRFLVTVGISKQAVITRASDWVKTGAIVLVAITTILNFVMVLLICSYRPTKPSKKADSQLQLGAR